MGVVLTCAELTILNRHCFVRVHMAEELSNQLRGKDLVEYVEDHREEFEGDGDALCVAAGYGIDEEDGTTKCDLPAFVNELGQATDLTSYEIDE